MRVGGTNTVSAGRSSLGKLLRENRVSKGFLSLSGSLGRSLDMLSDRRYRSLELEVPYRPGGRKSFKAKFFKLEDIERLLTPKVAVSDEGHWGGEVRISLLVPEGRSFKREHASISRFVPGKRSRKTERFELRVDGKRVPIRSIQGVYRAPVRSLFTFSRRSLSVSADLS